MARAMRLLERCDRLLDRLAREVQRHDGPRLVALAVFGSAARRAPREDADGDLLVVARDLPPSRAARVEAFGAVEARLGDARREVKRWGGGRMNRELALAERALGPAAPP